LHVLDFRKINFGEVLCKRGCHGAGCQRNSVPFKRFVVIRLHVRYMTLCCHLKVSFCFISCMKEFIFSFSFFLVVSIGGLTDRLMFLMIV
jgi:hypothetical protein